MLVVTRNKAMTVMASRVRKQRGKRKFLSHGDERRRRSDDERALLITTCTCMHICTCLYTHMLSSAHWSLITVRIIRVKVVQIAGLTNICDLL